MSAATATPGERKVTDPPGPPGWRRWLFRDENERAMVRGWGTRPRPRQRSTSSA